MNWLKRGLTAAAFAVVLYLFWPLVGELRAAADLFRQARWGWLVAAVLIQLVSYTFLTALNYFLLRPFPGRIGFGRLMAILPAMAFIEVAIPSAGASGLVLRTRFLARGGYSVEASTFTLILETIYLGVIMTTVALTGIFYLVRGGELGPAQLTVLGGISALVIGGGTWLAWAGRDRERARRWSQVLVGYWNRLARKLRRAPSAPEQILGRVDEFYEGLARLGHTPRWPLWLSSTGRVTLDVATLGACFAAFRYVVPADLLLTGYGMTLALSTLAALPGGLGLADASLAVIYARLGTPGAVAVAASLTYRLIAFWLLRFVGFLCWQGLERTR